MPPPNIFCSQTQREAIATASAHDNIPEISIEESFSADVRPQHAVDLIQTAFKEELVAIGLGSLQARRGGSATAEFNYQIEYWGDARSVAIALAGLFAMNPKLGSED